MIKEVCLENLERINEVIGKDINRIELCDNLSIGGTTVSYGVAKEAIKLLEGSNVDLMCIIRCRGGNFIYNNSEMNAMVEDVLMFKQIGIKGIVFGCLNSKNQLDKLNNLKLIKAAQGLDLTFHMAFDHIDDDFKMSSIDWLVENGVSRILTHGSIDKNDIFENIDRLKSYVNYTQDLLTILVGGGVTTDNYLLINELLKGVEFHGTKIV